MHGIVWAVAGWGLGGFVNGYMGFGAALMAMPVMALGNDMAATLPTASLLILALCFYPLALGWGPFDPYALGYQPAPLLAALLVLGVALWWRRQHSWLAIIGLDLLAYSSGIFANLWDALFDPLLVLLALAIVARQGTIRFIASRNR